MQFQTKILNLIEQIKILKVNVWMDGGSTDLICLNQKGQHLKIEFVQNASWEVYDLNRIPGRLYFNGELVDQRSLLESELLLKIRNSDKTLLDVGACNLIEEKLKYIESADYLNDQIRVSILRRKST